MKILLCSRSPVTASRGGAKVVVELADELAFQGWECDLRGPEDICPGWSQIPHPELNSTFKVGLRKYLQEHAERYDVVDYPFEYLPYARSEFPQRPLFVARSVLLTLHFQKIQIPPLPHLRSKIGHVLKKREREAKLAAIVEDSIKTFQAADLANVSSEDDKLELISRGIPAQKILALPYGISRERRPLFDAISTATPDEPLVAFVGTVDARKGINDLPRIFRAIAREVPRARFLMLGAGAKSENEVYAYFPSELHSRLTVQPRYQPSELPTLLAKCTLGIFPSHVEGFPFGVLEMLAAAIPVFAYNAPGPTMMLSPEYLAPRGNWQELAERASALLRDTEGLAAARRRAQERSRDFSWEQVATKTIESYGRYAAERNATQPGPV